MTPEGRLTKQITDWLKLQPATWHTKVHGSAYQGRGCPDVIAGHFGILCGIEVKRSDGKGKTAAIQAHNVKRINEAGGVAAVVTSLADVRHLLHTARLKADERYDHGE